ncbi:hypothetical protein CBR_g12029 [Chara braunii]|uniref:C2 domain-containing protein n=1 Tax=Chara braunii TaxID=69332 RepID=A0A388KQW6_CHABU|nr:hypothetical protein CBR_g12029 [Chara braunii]|eukprot:GBG72455.1 hypothetical protein CBR_g12029 [Chara braunii]
MGMKLRLCVVEARNLFPKDSNGLSDPYVRIVVGEQKTKSTVIYETLNPAWHEEFIFAVEDISEVLHLSIWDEDYMTDDFLGQVDIPLSDVVKADGQVLPPTWYPLQKRKSTSKISGEIRLGMSLLGKLDVANGANIGKQTGSVSPFSWRSISSHGSTGSSGSAEAQEEKENGSSSHTSLRERLSRLRHRTKNRKGFAGRSKSPGRLAPVIQETPGSSCSSGPPSPNLSPGRNEDAESSLDKLAERFVTETSVDVEAAQEVMPAVRESGFAVDLSGMSGPQEAPVPSDCALSTSGSHTPRLGTGASGAGAGGATRPVQQTPEDPYSERTKKLADNVRESPEPKKNIFRDSPEPKKNIFRESPERKNKVINGPPEPKKKVVIELPEPKKKVTFEPPEPKPNVSEPPEPTIVTEPPEPNDVQLAEPKDVLVPDSWFDDDGVYKSEAVSIPPPLAGGVVLNEVFSCTSKKLNSLFFGPGSEIVAEWQKKRKLTMCEEGPWKMNDVGLPTRQLSYMMPASSLVKATKASEKHTYSQAEDGRFVVDISVSTPDVPYGSTFRTEVQVCIFPEKAEGGGEGMARMRVSWRAKFLQSTMMKTMIENGMRKGITESYAVCLEVINKSVKPVEAMAKEDLIEKPKPDEIVVKNWRTHASEFLSKYVGKVSAAVALLLLFTLCVHILYAKAKVTQGLEFWWVDLPDSFSELFIAGVSFLLIERVVVKLVQFLWVSLIKGGDHGLKGKGEGWMVTITLLEARSLATADLTGFSDPYVVFTCDGQTRSSSIKLQTLNPTWNEILEFDAMEGPPSVMDVAVYDYDGPFLEPDELGTYEINFLRRSSEELADLWIPLEGRRARAAGSELHLRVFLHNSKKDDEAITPQMLEQVSRQGGRVTKRSSHQNIQFQKLFSLPDNEPLINDYACSLKKKIYVQGRLYVSLRLLGFYSNLFGHKTKFVILWEDIEDMKERHPSETYGLIPSITIYVRKGRGLDAKLGSYSTDNDGRLKFRFSSFVRPGPAFRTICLLWQYRTLPRDELIKKLDVIEPDKPDERGGTPVDDDKEESSSMPADEAEMSEGSQKEVSSVGRRHRRVAGHH